MSLPYEQTNRGSWYGGTDFSFKGSASLTKTLTTARSISKILLPIFKDFLVFKDLESNQLLKQRHSSLKILL
jgi:hypothetical protein